MAAGWATNGEGYKNQKVAPYTEPFSEVSPFMSTLITEAIAVDGTLEKKDYLYTVSTLLNSDSY